MHAFRRRQSFAAGLRLDPELVDFDLPARFAGGQTAEQRATEFENGSERLAVGDRFGDRSKPPRDAAVQRVVIETLIMRLMGPALDRTVSPRAEHRVTAP